MPKITAGGGATNGAPEPDDQQRDEPAPVAPDGDLESPIYADEVEDDRADDEVDPYDGPTYLKLDQGGEEGAEDDDEAPQDVHSEGDEVLDE